MIKAYDVAAYIVDKLPLMSTMKLQKLVYYSYVEHAALTQSPLFDDEIQAWVNGPIVPALFKLHKGQFFAEESVFNTCYAKALTDEAKISVNVALQKYGEWTAGALSEKTHKEAPWLNARKGCKHNELCSHSITFNDVYSWACANA